MKTLPYPLILASASPRRRQLLADLGYTFQVLAANIDESFDPSMPPEGIAMYLAAQKARHLVAQYPDNIVLAADTIVYLEGKVLNKPADEAEAMRMLQSLSGKWHLVYTGISVYMPDFEETTYDMTEVYIRPLSDAEIQAYIATGSPMDKAGSYGVQDWLGLTAVEQIKGSFYTVMGLPTHLVYRILQKLD